MRVRNKTRYFDDDNVYFDGQIYSIDDIPDVFGTDRITKAIQFLNNLRHKEGIILKQKTVGELMNNDNGL
jgi:hypothetical protein